jgi:heme exporter protein CcmD
MREALDHWPFVMGAYAIGTVALGWLLTWSYTSMRKAEKRREEMRRK